MQQTPEDLALLDEIDGVTVLEAARELERDPSRIRALIAAGWLHADKVDGRWLVHRDSILARRRHTPPVGRPIATRNAWALMLEASGEPVPILILPAIHDRLWEALLQQGFRELRGRLQRRARIHRLRAPLDALPGLRADPALVLTGASAAETVSVTLGTEEVAVDAYALTSNVDELRRRHSLRVSPTMSQANVILRAIDPRAWMLDDRRAAPRAAVAVDLASYTDPPTSRAGLELLERLDQELRRRDADLRA